ncbi:hypothetical protein N657DRAFT_661117 [Parathielavia appendiculata]|uniref:O-acyltransferase n=1 Tax=Parathielavia appendiculata TaxID=2587402 RepID=A0AAN6Z6D4_9PEZI|nr:hypothetical protein N657DRAFT_661117 [Parathielavia appendiculata]
MGADEAPLDNNGSSFPFPAVGTLSSPNDTHRRHPPVEDNNTHHTATTTNSSNSPSAIFTHTFSTFDRQNPLAASSPFAGFFTLFWMGVFFAVQIGADNWRAHGSLLGTNKIMRGMADEVMCGAIGYGWVLQKVVVSGVLQWDRGGWVLQHVWQTVFIAGVVRLTMWRDWPWTHTVFFVLHGSVMLRRARLLAWLKQLGRISPVTSPAKTKAPVSDINISPLAKVPTAKERWHCLPCEKVLDVVRIVAVIESVEPLEAKQVHVFEQVLKWEVAALSDELKGMSTTPGREYPNNLTLRNHYGYIVLPTVKAVTCFGPFMMEQLLTWYLVTYFADRGFYDAWRNCVSWDQFARDWNRPMHHFPVRHVYHSSVSALKVDKDTATVSTFFLSACVHELSMWCIFRKLSGYLLLVRLSRIKWFRTRPVTGPSILWSLYLIL